MTTAGQLTKACFTPLDSSGKLQTSKSVKVHFNPATLQYSITNTLENKGNGNSKKQYVTQSTAKLTMDLIFDTTDTGVDVRSYTGKIAAFMSPSGEGDKKVPSIVQFEWGKYKFQGMIEAYKETIEFFAANGVPLRSTVNLTLANQDKVFESSDTSGTAAASGSGLNPNDVELPGGSFSPAALANQAGSPDAARAIARANGQASLRFSSGPLIVSGSIDLGGPVAFASGSGGLSLGGGTGGGAGFSAGAGIGVSAGASAGFSATTSASAGANFSLDAGSSASAGVSAASGAFSGLHTIQKEIKKSVKLDTGSLLQGAATAKLATDTGATFGIGGQAAIEGSASLSADVGVNASLKAKLQFD